VLDDAMRPSEQAADAAVNGYEALARLHHGLFTGLVLGLIGRRSVSEAEEFVFRCFRRQHLEKFEPGLAKLGLTGLPHAVAAARYHYQSNAIGGVLTEYVEESDQKAWVRYPPPRWIWSGTAICAIPPSVNVAILRGWHAHNGITLGNPRLGFVCTCQTVEGAPGLEGYYIEEERPLAPEDRLRFARERMPAFDPVLAPQLSVADWPAERLAKAKRNYAIDYARTALPVLIELLGREEALRFGQLMARLVGMQFLQEIVGLLGTEGNPVATIAALARAGGATVEVKDNEVRQDQWPLDGLGADVFAIWRGLIEGLIRASDRFVNIDAKIERGVLWRLGRGL